MKIISLIMDIKTIFFFYFLIHLVYCAVWKEDAPVRDKMFRDLGYSCESSYRNLGVLRNGEIRKRYEHYICGQATCNEGVIAYETCGQIKEENDCIKRYEHYYQSYPDCCTPVNCD